MRIPSPEKRQQSENTLPMINVVFLLLIFFMISAKITVPDAIDVILPISASQESQNQSDMLLIGQDGTLLFNEKYDEAAISAAIAFASMNKSNSLRIKADSRASAALLARIVNKIHDAGGLQIALMVEAKP